ncbi:MAG TPA: class I SAM-dependent methyltransferase [Mycobacteriales bacterium]|nr:class I SAM-dependent methyltransferase [Mycobacteriales bacterium]
MDSSSEQRRFWDNNAKTWDPSQAVETDETAPMLDFLAELAGDGPALEFGIGTGRIAVPLYRRGVSVAGIDVSPGMLGVLHATVPPGDLPATVGSMADADAPGRDYRLVYIIANAISCLSYQDEQIACFQNAARHLRPGGHLVIHLWVPQLRELPPGQTLVAGTVTDTAWIIDSYDTVAQHVVSHHFQVAGGRVTGTSSGTRHRYLWPSEMDVMAKMAGLESVDRFAGWDRSPFTAESKAGVSVWRKPE